jgi:uncharacterized protein YkwD
MKKRTLILICAVALLSCTPGQSVKKTFNDIPYTYSQEEKEMIAVTNTYRSSNELSNLKVVNYISSVASVAASDMASTQILTHNGSNERFIEIQEHMGVEKVGEVLAYNYSDAESALRNLLNSATHNKVITGDYSYIGVSIKQDTIGKNYYVIMFAE